MQVTATVTAVHDNGTATVSVARRSACGHDCAECGGCNRVVQQLSTRAENRCGAAVGDTVVLHRPSPAVLKLAALLYLMPLLLFFIGICFTVWLGAAAFVCSMALVVVYGRRVLPRQNCDAWLSRN